MTDWLTLIAAASDASSGSGATMTVIVVASGFVGLVLGYVLGFRGGKIAGELEALKASLRHDRSSRRRRPSVPASSDDSGGGAPGASGERAQP